jgi:lipoprotein-anchoring transpeptidase ErfK/SrfK
MLPALEPRLRSALLWSAAALFPLACSGGCDRHEPSPRAAPPGAVAPSEAAQPAVPPERPSLVEPAPGELVAGADAGAAWDGGVPPYAGPYFTVVSGSTGIYAEPSPDRSLKLGYARSGGRIAVLPDVVPGEGCKAGYFQLVGGGYICGAEGSIDPNDPRVRLAVQAPDLTATLPYPYARNAQNGTPLYSSVPSRDQIALYEPYLQPSDPGRAAPEAGTQSWWRRKEAQLSSVRLAELALESDGVLGRRMVKGFYIAIDKEFEWSERSWYKTTKGMVAPKDRFVAVEGSDFHGIELDAEQTLPIAWVYGYRANRPTYTPSEAGKMKPSGVVDRLKPIALTGDSIESDGHRYLQSTAGSYVRADQTRVASTPPIPVGVTPEERWIHVDLNTQTLVALVGSTPVYATLISSGKESEEEDKDHRTPPGEFHIREKHVTTTMDGDGTAAGDLPYSIEDVPFVMYFQGSYALHGAFWHRNYGVRMSHGCINLAPLDAKYLFFFTGPTVRAGWHGAWAGNGQTGSRVVIDGPIRGSTIPRR